MYSTGSNYCFYLPKTYPSDISSCRVFRLNACIVCVQNKAFSSVCFLSMSHLLSVFLTSPTNSPPLFPHPYATTIIILPSHLAHVSPLLILPSLTVLPSVLYQPPSTFISSPPSLCHRSFQREFPSRDLDSVLQTATSPPEGFEP